MIFFISAAAAFLYETIAFNNGEVRCKSPRWAIFALSIIAALFVIFTFLTPEIELFRDPLTSTYGV